MARFWQRTRDQFTAPAQYIQTTDTVSRPLAVMTSLLMLFFAIAVILGLFFAGKWAYNEIAGNNDVPANPVTGISTGISTAPPSEDSSKSADSNSNGTATVTPNSPGTATVTANQPTGGSSTSASTSSSTSSSSATSVPNTGTGSLLGLFIGSTIIGTLFYRAILIRRIP